MCTLINYHEDAGSHYLQERGQICGDHDSTSDCTSGRPYNVCKTRKIAKETRQVFQRVVRDANVVRNPAVFVAPDWAVNNPS
jgi:hypothetical protein